MKFKAILTDYGVALLERRFVPAFEKIGKTCHVYLTRVHITLLHNVLNADGVQAVAQFSRVLQHYTSFCHNFALLFCSALPIAANLVLYSCSVSCGQFSLFVHF
jgi:hypothetical protein